MPPHNHLPPECMWSVLNKYLKNCIDLELGFSGENIQTSANQRRRDGGEKIEGTSQWGPPTKTQLLPHKAKCKEREAFFWVLFLPRVHPLALPALLLHLFSKTPVPWAAPCFHEDRLDWGAILNPQEWWFEWGKSTYCVPGTSHAIH